MHERDEDFFKGLRKEECKLKKRKTLYSYNTDKESHGFADICNLHPFGFNIHHLREPQDENYEIDPDFSFINLPEKQKDLFFK